MGNGRRFLHETAVPFTYGSTMYFVEYIWKGDQISGG